MSQKPSCSKQDWTRLHSLISAVSTAQSSLADYEERLPTTLENNAIYQNYLSKIQNKRVNIRVQKKELDRILKRIRSIQHRLTVYFENECKQDDKRLELDRINSNTISQIDSVSKENKLLKSNLILLKNELIYRRRFMFNELYKIYFFDNYVVKLFKHTCSCTKLDVIAGLHLPSSSERADHSEFQICGAISHLVNLLNCIGRIADIPLKNCLIFRGSNSVICNRLSGEKFDFYQTLTKASKSRFDLCQKLLCDIIAQFRSDCNLPVQTDLPISSLRETLLFCIGRYTATFSREKLSSNFYSCSSLIPRTLPSNSTSLSVNSLHIVEQPLEKSHSSECMPITKSKNNILEVISTS